MNKRIITILFFLILCVFHAGFVFAQDISVQAEVSSNQIALGSTANFTLTIAGTQDVDPIDFPDIEGFDVRYLGPSRRVSIVNNSYSSSISFTYSLFPTKVGTFRIPSLTLSIGGKTFTTEEISIDVVDSSNQKGVSSKQKTPVSLDDKIFLVLKTVKNDVYINERVPVKVLFFYSVDFPIRDVQYPKISNTGVVIDDFSDYKQYQDVFQGIRYNIIEFNTFLYATREGELTLGPAEIECNILIPNQRQRAGKGGLDRFFGDDFFNGFFGNYEKRSIKTQSAPMTFNVLSVPEDNKPEDFSGAVGKFDFDATISPVEIKVGDPITLKMTIKGNGSLEAISFPKISSQDDFKLYEPNIKYENGTKTLEQVLIPKVASVKEVPSLKFSYFDTASKGYRTITKGPFPISVEELGEGEQLKVVGLDKQNYSVETEELGKDINFIKDDIGRLYPTGKRFYQTKTFVFFMFLLIVAWGGIYGNYKWRHRLETDVVLARKLRAPRAAKKGLIVAQKHLQQGNKEEFFDALFKTLQEYLGNKFHLTSGSITGEAISQYLLNKNMDSEILIGLKFVFDQCDMVRYASASIDENIMNASYQKTEQVIDYLERHVR